MLEHERIGETTLVSIRCELDASTAHRVKEALDEVIEDGVVQLVMDLSSLSYVDSAGLGVLVSTLKTLRAKGGDLRLFGVQEPVKMIFNLTLSTAVVGSPVFPGKTVMETGWPSSRCTNPTRWES